MKMKTIEEIVNEEWLQFQLIHNLGGRSYCQSERERFEIKRKSRFLVWNEGVLNSYYKDLLSAKQQGRNLLFEKYVWMMQSTSPDLFREIGYALPSISWIRRNRINRTAFILARWGEAFAIEYPYIAECGRTFYSQDDKPWSTSIETFSKGELLSYSEETEARFSDFIMMNEVNDVNLTKTVQENMARYLGYASLEQYENMLRDSNGVHQGIG
jgi:hypothetical protein